MSTTPETKRDEVLAMLSAQRQSGRWARAARWIGAPLFVLVVAGVGLALRSDTRVDTPAYETEAVTRGDLRVAVSATGRLQPTNSVNVGSELSGLVEAVLVDENDTVTRGQVLARLDVSKLRDQITRSEAALVSAQAKLAQADATAREAAASLSRLREVSRLSGGKVPSQAEMETAEAAMARAEAEQSSAKAAVSEARAALSSDQTNLSKASIRSPIDGVVLSRDVEPGQAVAASLQVATLFTIAEDLQAMELEVNVDEADVGSVAAGQPATFTVDAYPERTYSAQLTRVAFGSVTSADVVSYPTLLDVDNDDLSLRPGMTASAEIVTAEVAGALLVPNAALRFAPKTTTNGNRDLVGTLMPGPPPGGAARQPGTSSRASAQQVWVLRDGSPVAVAITIGRTNGRHTEVTGGELREGMRVITDSAGSES